MATVDTQVVSLGILGHRNVSSDVRAPSFQFNLNQTESNVLRFAYTPLVFSSSVQPSPAQRGLNSEPKQPVGQAEASQ